MKTVGAKINKLKMFNHKFRIIYLKQKSTPLLKPLTIEVHKLYTKEVVTLSIFGVLDIRYSVFILDRIYFQLIWSGQKLTYKKFLTKRSNSMDF